MQTFTLLTLLATPLLVLAKDGYSGCTSTSIGTNVVFYVDGTGEICDYPADCGGGRAPPKSTVPGCPAYTGTETRPARYIPGFGPNAAATSAPAASGALAAPAAVAATASSSATVVVSSVIPSSSASSSTSRASMSTTTSASMSSSARLVSVSTTSTLRASNITTPSAPGSGTFNGEAGRVGAQIGLVAFFGAVLALF